MRLYRVFLLCSSLLIFAGLVACNKKADESTAAAGSAGNAASPVAVTVPTAFITQTTTLKREVSDLPKVDNGKGKLVANWLATLYRGEKVTLIANPQGTSGDYVQVKTSNDLTGWIKSSALLSGSDVREAVAFDPLETFDRPDMLALNAKKKVSAGTLLFVTKQRDQFTEINIGGSQVVWVLGAKLISDANEIMVAKLFAKARAIKESKSGGSVEELVKLARDNFSDARLVEVMEQEFGMPYPMVETPLPSMIDPASSDADDHERASQ
jgi:GW (Gly-Tryp) dipeptide domain